jgi:hypothetical protein
MDLRVGHGSSGPSPSYSASTDEFLDTHEAILRKNGHSGPSMDLRVGHGSSGPSPLYSVLTNEFLDIHEAILPKMDILDLPRTFG